MDNERKQGQGQSDPSSDQGFKGYATQGQDTILSSESDAIQSPTSTEEERVEAHGASIRSLGETPGDSNPALQETIKAQSGGVGSTAEMLMARESAEERGVRASGAAADDAGYQDQQRGVASQEYLDSDSGRPNWPDDSQREPADYMESPRANSPYGTGEGATLDSGFVGRVDAAIDRGATQASAQESRSGVAPVGYDAQEDTYERREMESAEPPSDMDMIAPEMSNVPPGDDDGR